MIVDLHCHSTASDGTLSPQALIDMAEKANVSCFALTDHDTDAGYANIERLPASMTLITGIELSSQWSGVNIHVVGLGFDRTQALWRERLADMEQRRGQRAEEIASRLEKAGLKGCLSGAQAVAGDRPVGRPDFARYLVESGQVPSVKRAFDRYLGRGKVGDVKANWPDVSEVCQWIRDAGGLPVLAHPQHYGFTRAKLTRLLDAFKSAGGAAIEVYNHGLDPSKISSFQKFAHQYQLAASLGSDFHSPDYWPKIGCDSRALGDCQPVWELLGDASQLATIETTP